MSAQISQISIRNFRSLASVSVELDSIAVLFGPNGSGKSTFLDTIWFVRDCAIRGVELASSKRGHGIGILYDGADDDDQRIAIALQTEEIEYQLEFDLSSGRIISSPGECLVNRTSARVLVNRKVGDDTAELYNATLGQPVLAQLREPEKLTLNLYLNINPSDRDAGDLDRLLHYVRSYHSRSFMLHRLKTSGSESSHETRLFDRGENAWSVLRNLHDRKELDSRFHTIVDFMKEAFPTFDGIILEQTGPNSIYASFLERDRRQEIRASGVSDGHLQLLLLLTALFSEGPDRAAFLLFDEPEISLHPWAISVLAKAIHLAAEEWNKQVLIATHSPVLISQFEPESILASDVRDGQTRLQRVSEITGIQDLLNDYATGSLYMAQMIGAQTSPELEEATADD